MDKLPDVLTSPVWWLSVVIAGIGINLISAYLKTCLDKRLSALPSWWTNRSAKRKAEFEAFVQRLADDPQALISAYYDGLCQRFYVVTLLLLATLFWTFATFSSFGGFPKAIPALCMLLGSFTSLFAFLCFSRAGSIDLAITESQERRRRRAEQSAGGDGGQAAAPQP